MEEFFYNSGDLNVEKIISVLSDDRELMIRYKSGDKYINIICTAEKDILQNKSLIVHDMRTGKPVNIPIYNIVDAYYPKLKDYQSFLAHKFYNKG